MKKIMNDPKDFVKEEVEGIIAAYGDKISLLNDDFRMVIRKDAPVKGKVGIVTGGGSGHLPLFLGYVGEGMLDGCAVGNVFASPASSKMADLIRACDAGAGVLCLFGNYGGDLLNFKMACEDVEFDDIKTETLLGADDVASSPVETKEKRRGVAGIVYAYKIAGAAADKMMSLDEVVRVTKKALENMYTMGIALSPCIVPEVGKPTFHIEEDELEFGMGIHGEKGIEVKKFTTADEIATNMLDKILEEADLKSGDEVSVMINGLGATPTEEQFIIFRKVSQILKDKGVQIVMPHIGEYATSMEMAGLSLTVLKLDEELKDLLRYPTSTPFYTNSNK